MDAVVKCQVCGNEMVEKRAEGLYCGSCRGSSKTPERAVHHEGFPHVVRAEEEP
jgi:hypothetical protein